MAASRPAWSVLLLTRERVVRVDLDARGGALGAPRVVEEGADTLLDGLERALRATSGLGERVVVSSEACWTQTLELRAAAVDGLDPAALEQALAFEIESSSGIPALESVIAWRALGAGSGGARTFRVTQIAASERTRARELLAAHGARLAAVLHPAGTGLAPGTRTGTADVEVWDRTTLLRTADAAERVLVSEVGRPSWCAAVEAWLGETGVAHVRLLAPDPELARRAHDALAERGVSVVAEAADDEVLRAAAVRSLPRGGKGGAPQPSPVLDCREVRAAGRAAWIACAALTLLVLALCGRDLRALVADVDVLEAESARLAARQADIARLRKDAAELRTALVADRLDVPRRERELDEAEHLAADLRGRYATLLRSLRGLARPEIVLSHLVPDASGRVVLEGVGLSPAGIDAYAAELAESLGPPWRCAPAATGRLGDGDAWGFRIRLDSQAPAGASG